MNWSILIKYIGLYSRHWYSSPIICDHSYKTLLISTFTLLYIIIYYTIQYSAEQYREEIIYVFLLKTHYIQKKWVALCHSSSNVYIYLSDPWTNSVYGQTVDVVNNCETWKIMELLSFLFDCSRSTSPLRCAHNSNMQQQNEAETARFRTHKGSTEHNIDTNRLIGRKLPKYIRTT